MIHIEDCVPLDKDIQGTAGWVLVDLTVVSIVLGKWKGKLTLRKEKETAHSYNWMAVKGKGESWDVSGEGAMLTNGSRISSANRYPFSLIEKVNNGIRHELSRWLNENHNKVITIKAPGRPASVNAAPPVPAAKPAFVKPTPLPAKPVVPAPKPMAPVARIAPPVIPPPRVVPESNGASVARLEVIEVIVSEILPFKGQPRDEFTEGDLSEMTDSLLQEKQKQLITVTPIEGVPGKRWELVDGERRYRGALKSGIKTLTAVVRHYKNKGEQFWDSFTMNWNRKGHTPLENSRAVARAMTEGKTVIQICAATGRSNCWVYQSLQLQKLDQSLQDCLRVSVPKKERMSVSTANVLSRIPDKAEQIRIWETAKKEKTAGLIKLKVEELAGPILSMLPGVRGRKRKPSDNAERLLRILQTTETDLAFMARVTDVDVQAFASSNSKANGMGANDLLRRIGLAIDSWNVFMKKVGKLA